MVDNIIDIIAARKWAKIPPDRQRKLVSNVYCTKCGITTIVDYSMYNRSYGIFLKGKCKNCGSTVARTIDDS